MSITNSPENINAFLHYGWLPRLDVEPPFPEEWVPLNATNETPSLSEGADILRKAVLKHVPEQQVVVPLSGGFDSRAMLAILHEQGKDITAVTLGVPGTYDFEIGKLVAKKFNIKHEAINVNEVPLSTQSLVTVAKEIGDWTNILETYWSVDITKRYKSLPIVSGFLGDFLAGSYSQIKCETWKETKNQFCKDNKVSRMITLTPNDYSPESALPDKPSALSISNYEELVYRVRHTCSLRPTAFKVNLGYKIPFRDEDWIKFMLNCTPENRKGQKFYQEMLLKNWPDFFNLPSKNYKGASIGSSPSIKKLLSQTARVKNKIGRTWPNLSHHLFGVDKMLNYTDFHNQIVHNPNIRGVILENLTDLEQRKCTPWLNLEKINNHLITTTNLNYHEGIMLIVLVNLEINIKASLIQ